MTDKEKISKVRAEVEKYQKQIQVGAVDNRISKEKAEAYRICVKLISIIDSMQEEPVSEDLEEEIGKYCSNPENFITYIDVGFKQSPIKKDDIPLIIKAIKFGAQWQKQQMIKEAVEGEVREDSGGHLYAYIPLSEDCGLSRLDKVKVLVIKED